MKTANLVVVGGPISVGKSSLVNSLNMPQVPEIDEKDELQNILLENTYKKGRVAPEVIELFFLQQRFKKYQNYSHTLNTHVLDRSIFESLWFAKGNMNQKSYNHFKKLWAKQIDQLINTYGKPKIYLLLTMNWETFKKRLFLRGRSVEIENFNANIDFFKKHVEEYEGHMEKVFNIFDIKYTKIATDNLTTCQVKDEAIKILKGAIND